MGRRVKFMTYIFVSENGSDWTVKYGKQVRASVECSVTRGGGSGFFLACEYFGRMFDNSFAAFAFLIFCFKWPGSVHSGSAS